MKCICLLILTILFAVSCTTESPVSEKNFVIKDQNGNLIADHAKIQIWTKKIVQEKSGDVKFTVTNVETYYANSSYSAFIYYELGSGETSNFVVTNYHAMGDNSGRMEEPCDNVSMTCSGNSCCQVSTVLGSGVFKCACNQSESGTTCSMTITCMDQ